MRRLAPLLLLSAACAGCAGVGEALLGSCAAAALQVGAEICLNAAGDVCSDVLCDDGDAPVVVDDSDEDVPEEIPPRFADGDANVDGDASHDPPVCRLVPEAGGTLRLSCRDGTSVVALGRGDEASEYRAVVGRTVDGDVVVDDIADVAALADVFAVTGSLVVTGPAFVRLRLPNLRSVGGDVVVRDNPRLLRAELPALVDVGGAVIVEQNGALSGSLLPLVKHARRVSVVENDALPPAEVERMLALTPG